MHCRPAAAGRVATRKKTENQRKKKTRKRRKINASGSRSGGIRTRGLLVPNQRFCRFFRFFPLPSGNCLVFPVFSGFCRLFPCFSAYFQTGLNRTFGRFLHFYRFNRPLQPPGLQHEDITCLAVWSIVWLHHCASSYSATSSGLDFFFPFQ